MFRIHFDRKFVITLLNFMRYDARIEYIDSNQLSLSLNHSFVSNAFDVLIKNFIKQMKIHRIIKIFDTFINHFIFFSLKFVSKNNDD